MTPEVIERRIGERCWSTIGVRGDRSCPELVELSHCRNCPVHSSAAAALADRPPPERYLVQQAAAVAEPRPVEESIAGSLVVFRIGEEWLGLDTALVVEVAPDRPVHRIPHRTGKALLGLVNVRGELVLCASLSRLLGIAAAPPGADTRARKRLLVLARAEERWAVPADEVDNVHRFRAAEVAPLPLTAAAGVGGHTRGVLTLGARKVGYISGDLLFSSLRRGIA